MINVRTSEAKGQDTHYHGADASMRQVVKTRCVSRTPDQGDQFTVLPWSTHFYNHQLRG